MIARDYILTGDADVIINVIDASNIERNLYLTTQLLEMEKNIVIALNMTDEAERRNIKFDIKELSRKLGIPVIPTIAYKNTGIEEVIQAAIDAINEERIYKKTFAIQ